MTKIKKILIANRGEIAYRVIKTARKMGIATVAVYSDADRKALHVRMADEAVHIGPSPANESYLVIEKIIKAAKDTGADAVHPGYGFLSENPDFVRACEAEGINFIGPSAESMEAMGLKDAAKKLMDAAGVPITPGYHGADQSPKLLKVKAGMIGYPVLIKAVAGGGGKGMRKVETESDFDAALASCQREAKSSFGNQDVLIEKYIQSPRHIEVQVFGDTHGNVVHMFERDCSLQRRHQKVIEEAPAPGMTDDVRAAMTTAAVEAAKTVNYVGAGTVEFIVDGSGKLRKDGFWFMEMNTRLQVEHPVTEMITGLDLVEWQIRVAQGEELPKQDEIKMEGHAVEARLYAEDPANDFLPSAGYVHFLALSWEDRVDSSLENTNYENTPTGQRVSIHYDPMIAKLISHERNRFEAIKTIMTHISNTVIHPLKTNAAYLHEVVCLEQFQDGTHSTHTLSESHNAIISKITNNKEQIHKAAIMGLIDAETSSLRPFGSKNHFSVTDGVRFYAWRLNQEISFSQTYFCNGKRYDVVIKQKEKGWEYIINNETIDAEFDRFICNPKSWERYRASQIASVSGLKGDTYYCGIMGQTIAVNKVPSIDLMGANSNTLTASMPGKIIAVNAKAGDSVKADDPLIVMEAMKMEMTLEAPRDGVVAEVNFDAGALVSDGEVLLTLEAEA